jgi:hypothetical protein
MELTIDDIHRIRIEHYERTQDMTFEERKAYTDEQTRDTIKRLDELKAKRKLAIK